MVGLEPRLVLGVRVLRFRVYGFRGSCLNLDPTFYPELQNMTTSHEHIKLKAYRPNPEPQAKPCNIVVSILF